MANRRKNMAVWKMRSRIPVLIAAAMLTARVNAQDRPVQIQTESVFVPSLTIRDWSTTAHIDCLDESADTSVFPCAPRGSSFLSVANSNPAAQDAVDETPSPHASDSDAPPSI